VLYRLQEGEDQRGLQRPITTGRDDHDYSEFTRDDSDNVLGEGVVFTNILWKTLAGALERAECGPIRDSDLPYTMGTRAGGAVHMKEPGNGRGNWKKRSPQ